MQLHKACSTLEVTKRPQGSFTRMGNKMTTSLKTLTAKLADKSIVGPEFDELCAQIEALDSDCPRCGQASEIICKYFNRHFAIAVIETTPAIAKKSHLHENTAKPGEYWIPKYVYENLGLDLDATFTLANI